MPDPDPLYQEHIDELLYSVPEELDRAAASAEPTEDSLVRLVLEGTPADVAALLRALLEGLSGPLLARRTNRKLTPAIVRELRRRSKAGERGADLADALGLKRNTVYDVLGGKSWVDVL